MKKYTYYSEDGHTLINTKFSARTLFIRSFSLTFLDACSRTLSKLVLTSLTIFSLTEGLFYWCSSVVLSLILRGLVLFRCIR